MTQTTAPNTDIVDTHIHFYGEMSRYPLAPTAQYKPPLASLIDYRQTMVRLGIGRFIAVQPVGYGLDNRCLLDVLKANGTATARGVATIDEAVGDEVLAAMNEAGICGARFYMLAGGAVRWNALEPVVERISHFGWHINLQIDGRTLPDIEDRLSALQVPLVIDHTGKFLEPVTPDDPAFRALLRLVEAGNTWVKLSAPYETSRLGPPDYADIGVLAGALARARPDRLMWASNWPHGRQKAAPPDDATLHRALMRWLPDERLQRSVFCDNPNEFYGFG